MKITKQIAEDIAYALLETKQKELDEKIRIVKEKIREQYLKLLPKQLLNTYKKFPSYFSTTNTIGYNLTGSYNCYFSKVIPYTDNTEKETLLKNTCIANLRKLLEDETKIKELRERTKESIYALRTSKNVELMFPELIPYLPKAGVSNQLAINFQELFSEIQDFPKQVKVETKEEKIIKVKESIQKELDKRKNNEIHAAQVLEDGGF